MIVTASKFVNARIGSPSVNAPNPKYLNIGDNIEIAGRVLGDPINGNHKWILSKTNEYYTEEAFHMPGEIKAIPFFEHLTNTPQLFKDLQISKLWENTSMGEKIKIGIIDNGVAQHTSIKAKVRELNPTTSFPADQTNHGTTMACIIGSLDETIGKIGVSPLVENIFSYTINIDNVEPPDLINALDLMLKAKVNILNMSFCTNKGVFFPPRNGAVEIQDKINELANKGCIIVSASGNNHLRNQDFYPAKYENIISVAGYDLKENLDFDSNLWNGITICTPSVQHYFSDMHFAHSNGTSSATAIMTACLACVYNKINSDNKTQIIKKIFASFPPIRLSPVFESDISIPKFDTNLFLKSLNTSL